MEEQNSVQDIKKFNGKGCFEYWKMSYQLAKPFHPISEKKMDQIYILLFYFRQNMH